MKSGPLFATDTFLWGLAAICQLHRRPFAPNLILQQFQPPYGPATFEEAAAALNLKSGLRAAKPAEFGVLPAPFLAILKPVPGDAEKDPACGLAIVLECDGGKVSFLVENGHVPSTETLSEFGDRYAGFVLLCRPEQAPISEPEGPASAMAFGFRWFVPELLKYSAIWRDVLVASLFIQVIALAAPLCTQVIIDKVVVHQTFSTLTVVAIALALFVVFNAIMSWVRQYLVLHTGNRVDAVLGTRAFAHLLALPIRFFERRSTGVLVARLQGVETIREFVSGAAVSLLLDLPFLGIFLAVMFYYSGLLTAITLAILAVIVVISIGIVPVIRRRLNEQFLLGARNTAFMTEYLSGMETVKSLQMEPQLKGRFASYLSSYLDAGFRTRQLSNTYSVAAHALEQTLTFTILCVGAWLVMENAGFTIGMLVAYQMLATRVSQPVLRLVGLWQELQQAAVAIRRLADIMDAPSEPYAVLPRRSVPVDTSIEAIDLGFRYGDRSPFLHRHLSFKLEFGQCVAIVGPSGTGKSTLARLLLGFYLPSEGRILIAGRDTQTLHANELRQYFGVVPQETTLFSGTIYDNLTLANPHATFEKVVQACRMADIQHTIEELADGYQTVIGEHGVGLSGGQKQRLAIARALLKNPQVLVFDEATSHLDQATAEHVARTINRLRGRVTVLFIAHDVPNGLIVDRVVTLGAGATR